MKRDHPPVPKPTKEKHQQPEMATTSISLPARTMKLLKLVALKRQQEQGGRDSVSAVIADLIERNRSALEREAKTLNLTLD